MTAGRASGRSVAAVVLAAGRSSRTGSSNKLLATFDGVPLVRRGVISALRSRASPVIVVIGHEADAIRAALGGLHATIVDNPIYAQGLSTSLKAGLAEVPREAAGALIVLADMPAVTAEAMDRMLEAFSEERGPAIMVATAGGKRGNPVLWSRAFFAELAQATGDAGGRHLLELNADAVRTVEIGAAAALDVDTAEAIRAAGGLLPTLDTGEGVGGPVSELNRD